MCIRRPQARVFVVVALAPAILFAAHDAVARPSAETAARAATSDGAILEPLARIHDLGDASPVDFGPILAVAGGFAYLAGGGVITVVDVRPPGGPRPAGELVPPHEAHALLVHRGVLYAAGPGALMAFALDDPAAPRLVGTLPAAALSGLHGLISGSRPPVLTGLGQAAGDMVVVRIVDAQVVSGLAAIDVSDPAQPLPVEVFRSVTVPGRSSLGSLVAMESHLLLLSSSWGTYSIHSITAYAMSEGRVESVGRYDQPRDESIRDGAAFVYTGALAGDRLLTAGEVRKHDAGRYFLQPFTWVFDVSDPARIRREAVLLEGVDVVAADRGRAVAVSDGRLTVYDVSEPTRPRRLADAALDGTVRGVELHGARVVLALEDDGRARVEVVVLADGGRPAAAGAAAYRRWPSGVFAVAAAADRVLAATERDLHALGFSRAWEPRSVESPDHAGPPSAPLRVVADGATYALGIGNILTRGPIDRLDRSQSLELDAPIRDLDAAAGAVATIGEDEATLFTDQGTRSLGPVRGGVAVRLLGRHAFLADAEGIQVVDVAAPPGSGGVGRIPLAMDAGSSLTADRDAGRVLAVARRGDAVSVRAVRVDADGRPATGPPAELGTDAGVPNGVATIVDGYLLLAVEGSGLRVIDVADPDRPVEHPVVATAAEVREIAALESRYVLLAEGTSGLEVMGFRPEPLPAAGFATPCGVTHRADAAIAAWAVPAAGVDVAVFRDGEPVWSGRPADARFVLTPTLTTGTNTLTLVAENARGASAPGRPLVIELEPERSFDPLGVTLAYATRGGPVVVHPRDAAGCADPDAGWTVRLPADRAVTLRVPVRFTVSAAVTATLGSQTRALAAAAGDPATFEGVFGPLGRDPATGAAAFDLHIEADGARSEVGGRRLPPAVYLPVLSPALP